MSNQYRNSVFHYSMTLCFLFWLNAVSAIAQTTAFTYQGKLTDNGNLANGQYDLQFKLFDALSAGTQQGTTQTVSNVTVTSGIFTVSIDFGVCASCFNGAARFLEIAVKPTSGGSFTTLTPRQPITSNPYALRSLNAAAADGLSLACVNCVTSSQVQTVQGSQVTGNIAGSQINGTIPVASVPAGSANYIQNGTSQQATSNFNISGNGTVGGTLTGTIVNAAHYNIGSVPVLAADGFQGLYVGVNAGSSRMPAINSCCDTFVGFDAGMHETIGTSNSLFGSFAGASITDGDNNSFFGFNAGVSTTGSANCFFGRAAGQSNTTGTGNITIGHNADVSAGNLNNAIAIGTNAIVAQSNSLVLGGVTGVHGGTTVSVGIGVTAPSFRLHVIDPGNTGLRVETDTAGGTVASYGGFGDFLVDAVNVAGGRFTILENGRVGIGANAPLDKLQVLGDIRVGTGTTGCVKDADATVIAGTCSSDARLKRDITPFPHLLDKVAQLQPVQFFWRAEEFKERHFGSKPSFGLIAQEVERVLPELVSEDEQGYKAVNYSKLPLLSIQAIKELKAENDALKQKLNEQQSRLVLQEKQLAQQQQQLTEQQQEMAAIKKLLCQSNPQVEFCKAAPLK